MTIDAKLAFISTISGFFPVFATIYNYKYLDNVLKIAASFFLVEAIIDPAMWLLIQLGEKDNMPFIHVNIIVTVLFFSVIYYKLFLKPV